MVISGRRIQLRRNKVVFHTGRELMKNNKNVSRWKYIRKCFSIIQYYMDRENLL